MERDELTQEIASSLNFLFSYVKYFSTPKDEFPHILGENDFTIRVAGEISSQILRMNTENDLYVYDYYPPAPEIDENSIHYDAAIFIAKHSADVFEGKSLIVNVKKIRNILDISSNETYGKVGNMQINISPLRNVDLGVVFSYLFKIIVDEDFIKDREGFIEGKLNRKQRRKFPENRVADKQLGTKHTEAFINAVTWGMEATGETKKQFIESSVLFRLKHLGIEPDL